MRLGDQDAEFGDQLRDLDILPGDEDQPGGHIDKTEDDDQAFKHGGLLEEQGLDGAQHRAVFLFRVTGMTGWDNVAYGVVPSFNQRDNMVLS